MHRLDRSFWIALLAIGCLWAMLLGCGEGASTPPPPVISVMVSPASATLAVNATQEFTATIQNDASNVGVTWSLTQGGAACSPGCGMVGPTSTASSGVTTYTPPATIPTNATVTLTATSVADATKSASATLTIAPPRPISVSVLPGSASVVANTGFGFTATVLYDTADAGVTWALTQGGSACAPGCGTLDLTNTASGATATYTAPASVPANPTVTLTATSVTDPGKSASATVTVTLPPVSVSVSPASVLMGVNSTQQFTATLKNDPANKGVTWAPSQNGAACSPTCGAVAPSATASGESTTYTAPSTISTNTVAIVATSVSDTGSTGGAAITLTNGTVKLVPATLAFGRVDVNKTVSTQIEMTNTGASMLTIMSIAVTGGPASLLVFSQISTCGGALAAAASCSITVSFTPTSKTLYAAKLQITDSSADSPQIVSLNGKGQAPASPALRSALAAVNTIITPTPTGPNGVGTRVVQLVDSSRRDPYDASVARRELLVRFWYPASLANGCKPAEYTSPKVWSYFSELVGVRLPVVTTNSCMDAPFADGRHPIVVFTHGYTGTFTDYTFLFEDLASRGYVVASVDHTYEATAVEFPDGRFVESVPGSHFGQIAGNDASELAFAVFVRLEDLKFVVTELKRLNEIADGPFNGRLDVARIALAGHSLGGVTTLLGAQADPRIKAGIIMDGFSSLVPAHKLATPTMLLGAGREPWGDTEQDLWESLIGPRFAVNLKCAEHITPTDLVWLARGAVKTGTMGPEKSIAAMRNYIAAFLDANLRDEPSDRLLAGPSSDYPDAAVTTQAEPLCCRK
jgi:dienelactone hydrolase